MTPITILDAMDDPAIFGRYFRGPSWDAWRAFLAALFALPMSDEQLAIYRKHTGRLAPPVRPFREAWLCCGRRSGKSLIAALISVFLSVFRDYSACLGPGEVPTAMTVSPDRKQSRIIRRFEGGLVRSVPAITAQIIAETRDSLEFPFAILEVQTASDAVRGYVSHVIVNDEVCFLPVGEVADPDVEIISAERPCLASLPDSLLLSISSPYARRGVMFDAYEKHFGKDTDVLFWKASSLEMNPTLDERIIAAAYEEDPDSAASEWGGDFRSDCERLFTVDAIERSTDPDRPLILPPSFEEEEVEA
jgi:hypothetical protein